MLRNPEIQQFCSAVRKHDVAGFQVSVDDSYLMKRFQRGKQSQRNLPSLLSGQGAALEPPCKRFSLNEFHHQDQAVLLFGYVVDPAGIRMRAFANYGKNSVRTNALGDFSHGISSTCRA